MLTPSQIDQYHREGYLIVEGLLNDDDMDAFVAYEALPKPEDWYYNLRHHVDDTHWRALATHSRITSAVQQLLKGRPMIVQTMYMERQPATGDAPGSKGIAFHQDLHYLPCEPPTLMACWLALTDTDAENGGLCVVPQSHQGGLRAASKNQNTEEHDAWDFEYLMRDRDGCEWKQSMYSFDIVDLDPADIVPLTVPRGAGVFFTGLTIHGSYTNRSTSRVRRAFATHYIRDDSWLFRADVQTVTPAI